MPILGALGRLVRRRTLFMMTDDTTPVATTPAETPGRVDFTVETGTNGNGHGTNGNGHGTNGSGWTPASTLRLRPINDRGGSVGLYTGPSGPIATLARINLNLRLGRKAADGLEGLGADPLNDPNSP